MSMRVPTSIASRIVKAPRYLPATICQGWSGSVMSSSIVPALYSAANSRIESSGVTSSSSSPMFWNVLVMVASPVRKTL